VLRNSLYHVNTGLLVMHYFTAKFAVYCCVCRLQIAQTWVQGGNVSRSEYKSTCACFIECQLEALIFLFQRCMF